MQSILDLHADLESEAGGGGTGWDGRKKCRRRRSASFPPNQRPRKTGDVESALLGCSSFDTTPTGTAHRNLIPDHPDPEVDGARDEDFVILGTFRAGETAGVSG